MDLKFQKDLIFQKIKWVQFEFAFTLYKLLGSLIHQLIIRNNEIELKIINENLESVTWLLKYNTYFQFDQLIEITVVDTLMKANRFKIIYSFFSLMYKTRISLSFRINELDSIISLNYLFNSAGWLEREIFDMYGILFSGNSDLRRILNDYGFQTYPLRKDVPLTGQMEKQYSSNSKILETTSINGINKTNGLSLRLQYQNKLNIISVNETLSLTWIYAKWSKTKNKILIIWVSQSTPTYENFEK